ncbi:metallophosphoesterase [Paenibacillus sp. HB172176]|uniref:metallophosphoesterase n=1 Tax=Paenibacillus sp. HB172176 TaxID=2493690 RepID=UPI00143A628D|nr:metallophosphoesterase [Paenibacillus sp. HB172176]
MTKRGRRLLLGLLVFILASTCFVYVENNVIGITKLRISSSKLPDGFDTFRIVHLSDVHNKEFGSSQHTLLGKIRKLKPDLIVVTGDLIDSRRYHPDISLELMSGAAAIAPVYFIPGNHEYEVGEQPYAAFEQALRNVGVHVLRNENTAIAVGDGVIRLIGVDDPIFNRKEDGDVDKMNAHLDQAMIGIEQTADYTILLSHRTELFSVYAERGIDISFTGHAHGGQVRIPFVGGVYAPEQGFWPKYTAGLYELDGSAMVTSRGLGNSGVPLRLFNRPQLILVELTR